MKRESKTRKKPTLKPNLALDWNREALRLEDVLRQPRYAEFVQDLQQKIDSQPRYLDDHWEETFRRTLAVLAQAGDLKDTQPSEQDVEEALAKVVMKKNH